MGENETQGNGGRQRRRRLGRRMCKLPRPGARTLRRNPCSASSCVRQHRRGATVGGSRGRYKASERRQAAGASGKSEVARKWPDRDLSGSGIPAPCSGGRRHARWRPAELAPRRPAALVPPPGSASWRRRVLAARSVRAAGGRSGLCAAPSGACLPLPLGCIKFAATAQDGHGIAQLHAWPSSSSPLGLARPPLSSLFARSRLLACAAPCSPSIAISSSSASAR